MIQEHNTEPEEEWLKVWTTLERSLTYTNHQNKLEALTFAIYRLYELLEPPSVRNRRQEQGGER